MSLSQDEMKPIRSCLILDPTVNPNLDNTPTTKQYPNPYHNS